MSLCHVIIIYFAEKKGSTESFLILYAYYFAQHHMVAGLMIMASHRTFPAKISICLANSILARQIHYTLSMETSLSLLKIMNVQTNFGPYHKHWIGVTVCLYGLAVII